MFKIFVFIVFSIVTVFADAKNYKNKAHQLQLYNKHYWQVLLHMQDGKSAVDDPNFFFSKSKIFTPKDEMDATLDAFFNDEKKDDNSSICRFPARYHWLKEQLGGVDFPVANCKEYEKVLKRVDPQSVTLVFPSAHINSPASMFGHTFLRINSSYHSRLLAYAINYAADADPDKENGVVFAIKGLVGGYSGKYSFMPYYDKLKEYRDSEQRDIWEYDLDFTQEETLRMFRHIWELNNTHSSYLFFTNNCSYNMLWLMESARDGIELRKYFHFQVIPLESVHVVKSEGLITSYNYRASKRTVLLKYEKILGDRYVQKPVELCDKKINVSDILHDDSIKREDKQHILEAAIELIGYKFTEGKVKKDEYLTLFHNFTVARATLGQAKGLHVKTPPNPIDSHRAIRSEFGVGSRDKDAIGFIGIRPAYHDLSDSNYGFLRGTHIDFLNLLFSYSKDQLNVEKATIIAISSIAQRTSFFKPLSWRVNSGFDNDFLDKDAAFNLSVGAGFSWGNEFGFAYMLLEPLIYLNGGATGGLSGVCGFNIDRYKLVNLNFEISRRYYTDSKEQNIIHITNGYATSQNTQIMLKYDYKDKYIQNSYKKEDTFGVFFRYYF